MTDADPDDGDIVARIALQELRARLSVEQQQAEQALQDLRRTRSGAVDDDEHDPEGAPLSGEWARLDGLHRAAGHRIAEVDAALANIDAGRYGVCTDCGGPIPAGRLEAVPTATRCIRCVDRRSRRR